MLVLLISTLVIFLFTSPFIVYEEVFISFSKAFLIGVLYNNDYIEDEKVTEHTAQYSFICIVVTYIWYTEDQMDTRSILVLIAKKHKTWIDIVKSFGCNKETAEDLVQEMYIKIFKYLEKGGKNIMYKDEINYYFIFKALNSVFIDLKRKSKNIKMVEIENLELEDADLDYDKSYKKITDALSQMFWYDRKVFEIINEGESIAEFSRKSYIPYYSLYNTYQRVKKELKNLL